MASQHLPLVVRLTNVQSIDPDLQRFLDKCSSKMRMVSYDKLPKDEYTNVKGIFQHGYPFNLKAEVMDLFPNARVIAGNGSGIEHIDIEAATKRGIKVGNTKNAVQDATADHAIALMLASARNVVSGDAICKSPNLQKYDNSWFGHHVTGSTLGIVGLGSIGTAVAQRAKGFRMKILYYNRTRKETLENQLGVKYCHTLTDLLKQADFVVICARLTPQTKHMISASELSCMKPTATLINIARGGLINQDDLVTALKTGQIHAAALDVTTPEPLPRDHPLLTLPNVIMTPHIGSATMVCREDMLSESLENLVAGLKGEPLPSPVN